MLRCGAPALSRVGSDLLGWKPRHDAYEILSELVQGLRQGAGAGSTALRPRRVVDGLLRGANRGSVDRRRFT